MRKSVIIFENAPGTRGPIVQIALAMYLCAHCCVPKWYLKERDKGEEGDRIRKYSL